MRSTASRCFFPAITKHDAIRGDHDRDGGYGGATKDRVQHPQTSSDAGRTKVARRCRTRRLAATAAHRDPHEYAESRMNRPPPPVHGKEGVGSSSPPEGSAKPRPCGVYLSARGRCTSSRATGARKARAGPARTTLSRSRSLRRLKADPSRKVRTMAAHMLGPAVHRREDFARALEEASVSDSHPVVRKVASWYVPGGPIYRRLAPKPPRSARASGSATH